MPQRPSRSSASPQQKKFNRRRRVVAVTFDRRAPGSRAIDPIERAAAQTVADCVFDTLELRQMMAAHIVGSNVSYATIQGAVDAAAAGATVTVDSGTYNESVSIYKPLTLLGNNAGVDGRGARKAESIISDGLTAVSVGANNVTIDGFKIQGTDANVGARLAGGIFMKPNINGTKVFNNFITNNVSGILLSNNSDTNACIIQRNYFYHNYETGFDWTQGWNGNRAILSNGDISGGLLTNVLIDSNKFYEDGNTNSAVGAIGLEALNADRQFNVTISRNTFNSANNAMSKAILAFNVANVSVIGNDASGTNDAGSGAFRFEGNADNVNIQYNNVHDNVGPGVAVDPRAATGDSSGFVVNYNNFVNNTTNYRTLGSGVIFNGNAYTGGFDARYNWWNSTAGPRGDGGGTDNNADGVYGNAYINYNYTYGWLVQGKGVETFGQFATAKIDTTSIPVPSARSGLAAGAVTSSKAQLNWIATYSTATSQTLQRSTDGGTTWTTVATLPPLLGSYTDTGLTSGKTYTYRITASNPTGTSAAGSTVTVTPPAYQPPVAPSGLAVAAATANGITLTWAPAASNVDVAGYNVYRNGTLVGTTTGANAYTDTGLTPTTAYQYSVAMLDGTGAVSAKSAAVSALTAVTQVTDGGFEAARTPGYAYNPTAANWTFAGSAGIAVNGSAFGAATAPDGTQVAFIQSGPWASVSQSLITGAGNFTLQFQIASRSGSGVNPVNVTVDGKVIATVKPASTAFALYTSPTFTLTAGNHTIAFVSVNTTGDTTSFIDAVALNTLAVPPAPASVSATPLSTTQMFLRWQMPAGANVASYTLQRSTDGTTFTNVATGISGNATTYTDTGLSAGTTYAYRVIAVNGIGASPASAAVSTSTLTAGARSTALSSLTWTSATSGWSVPKADTSVAGKPITIRGTTYASGVGTHADSTIVYDLAGKYQTFSGVVGIDDGVPSTATPGVTFQVWGDGKLLFDSGVVGRSTAGASFAVNVAGVKTLTLMATSATPGNIDYCHADWAGVTLVANATAPAAPTQIVATPNASGPSGGGSVTVTWQGDGTQANYVIQRSDDGGKTYANVTTVSGTTATYTDTTVAASKTYLYRVVATNAAGSGPASAADDATTPAYQPLVAPAGLKATTTTSSASLSWTAVTGATGYVVYRDGKSVGTVTSGVTFTDTGLTDSTTYRYTVAALDTFNAASPQSTAVAVTTQSLPAATLSDGSFESTRVTGYAYRPSVANWAFANNAGLQANGSAWNAAAATDGTQTAFLQSNAGQGGSAGQSFAVNKTGSFTFSFALARRTGNAAQPILVSVDGKAVGTYTPGSTAFQSFTTGAVTLAAGTHTLSFATTLTSGDNSSFLDAVSVATQAVLPAVPAGLAAVATSATQVRLTWTAPTDATATSYVLQRSTDGTTFADAATLDPTALAYTDTNLAAGTTYGYRLLAANAAGRSAPSATVSAKPIATTATSISSLNWTSATSGWKTVQKDANVKGATITLRGKTYARGLGANADSVITYDLTGRGYTTFASDIGVDDAAGGRGTVVFQIVGDGKVLFDSGTLTGTSATVSVRVDVTGVKTLQLVAGSAGDGVDYDQAVWADATLLSPADAAPAAPTALTAVAAVDGNVRLAWTNASPTATLRVQRSTDGVAFTTLADNLPAGTTAYADATTQPGVGYTYRVIALNGAVASPAGNAATVTTVSAAAVVTNLSSLTWTSATSGWNSVQKDTSVAGKTLTLRGTTYATGLGAHADSQIVYDLTGGNSTRFQSDVGIDDGVPAGARVVFRVYGDGVLLFDSGVVTQSSAAVAVDVAIAGVKTLTLVAVTAVPGDIDYAHANWAGARLVA